MLFTDKQNDIRYLILFPGGELVFFTYVIVFICKKYHDLTFLTRNKTKILR